MGTPPMTSDSPGAALPVAGPVAPAERILAIDVVRGFALFGILLVNMAFFSRPLQSILLNETVWGPWDHATELVIRALAEGKFYVLFSLLFGLGMALQMERAAAAGRGFAGYAVRRLLVLLAIGVGHAVLLWYGDILTPYAVLGFLLLAFRGRRDRTILIWAGVIYLVPLVIGGVLTGLIELARLMPDSAAEIDKAFALQRAEFRVLAATALQNYGHGSWADALRQRLTDLSTSTWGYFFIAPVIAAMFLTGLVIGRRRILQAPEQHVQLLRTLAVVGIPVGLACNVGFATVTADASLLELSGRWYLAYVLQAAGAPLLAGGYAAALVLLLRREAWSERLRPLAAVGRMALTNYLLQSIICTTLFYGYGFGLFGKVGPAAGAMLALVIYAAQVPVSAWWLARFRFGPAEWAWRTLTYGRWQPMRAAPTIRKEPER